MRGWLECDNDQLDGIKAIIAAHDKGWDYSKYWAFPELGSLGQFAFYGGSIREQATDWLLDQIREMATLTGVDEDNPWVHGMFLASHEVDGMSEWLVSGGQLVITPADPKYHPFDA
nr:hypothetical protein [Kibdelosporangium sp. MJ126-NF4]CTQ96771.1 hypothetical protein [Kibdelosporangium sp. MJ126-NF4]